MGFYRTVTIDDADWRYRIGKSNVAVRGPNGESWSPAVHEVIGVTPNTLEHGRRDGSEHGMCKPSDVKDWILRQRG